jgi:alpha-tubulin suppressor-like RCC1 family protein
MSGALQALFQNWRSFTAPAPPAPDAGGALYAVGLNTYGQLGQSDLVARSSPVQVGALTTWLSLFAGATNVAAIKNDGTLWTWGLGTDGVGGRGDTLNRSSPVQVGALTTWLTIDGTISANGWAALAIKTDGTLWSWGSSVSGILGQNDTIFRSSPVQVGALTTWSKISVGHYNHVLAVKTDGTLWSWGGGHAGLGQNNLISRSSPVQVGALTTWLNVAAGYYTGAAIKTDGTLWGWGYHSFAGATGLNEAINRSSPVQVGALTTWSTISKSNYSTMAIKTDGTLWAWGSNTYGGLGQSDTINRSSPVQIGVLTNWSKADIGSLNSAIAIKTDGTLWSWGQNTHGQLLLGDTINRSSPVQVGALTTWLNISAGRYGTLATATP